MIINLKKKLPVALVALAACGSAFAVPDMESRLQQLEQQMKQVRTETAFGTFGANTAIARPEVDGNGVFLTADILYWHPKVGGSEFAYSDADTNSAPGSFGAPVQGNVKDVNFDWDWGFRFGLGYNFDHDGWDVYLNFTDFTTSDGTSLSAGLNSSVVPLRGSVTIANPAANNLACLKAQSNFYFSYENLDLELGRQYFVSHSLAFRPFFGLRSTWLDQKQNTQYTGGAQLLANTFHVNDTNNFWGLGPKFGMNSKWFVGNGFSIFANVTGALLYGYYDVSHKEYMSNSLTNRLKLNGNMHRFSPNAQVALGLSYDKYLNNNKDHVGIMLGYEANYYFRQNQMLQARDAYSLTYDRASEDTSMYGITLNLRWDF